MPMKKYYLKMKTKQQMKTKTEEDGWGCVPELQDAIDYIEECSSDIYEIKNCVRNSDLSDLINNIKNNNDINNTTSIM